MSWYQSGCSSVPERFVPSNPINPTEVTHQIFDDLLQVSVQEGQVNYPALQMDSRFAAYLALLDRVDPLLLGSDLDRLAFWINAYNAFAIQGILDGYSPRPYLGWYRYFKGREYAVGGQRLTLSDLEHAILRKQFREPRIHFAIVCASVSCPKLSVRAYRGERLHEQLDAATMDFVNDLSKNRFDRQARIAYLSRIFDWFEEDFMGATGSVLGFISRYVKNPELARELRTVRYRIEYLEYDWSLNGIPPKEVADVGAP